MAGMNMLAARGSYALGASAASGASAIALSYALPMGMNALVGGSLVLCVTNVHATDPVHVQLRSQWTDMNNASQSTHLGLALSGTSAVTMQTLTWVGSNASIAIPYTNVVGSAVQVIIMNAVAGTSSLGASGVVALWGL